MEPDEVLASELERPELARVEQLGHIRAVLARESSHLRVRETVEEVFSPAQRIVPLFLNK
jgi:hypothetical protein